MTGKCLKPVLFLALFAYLYSCAYSVLISKGQSVSGLQDLYESGSNTVDVLFMGNSLSQAGLDPTVFWLDQGIASLPQTNGNQMPHVTYFRLIESLKTQSIKLVVINLGAFASNMFPAEAYNPQVHTVLVQNNFGWRFSQNMLDMFKETFKSMDSSRALDFFLGLPVFHSRYAALTQWDFAFPRQVSTGKGFWAGTGIVSLDAPPVVSFSEVLEMSCSTRKWFQKIIECAEIHNFKILFLVIPFLGNVTDIQKISNGIAAFSDSDVYSVLNYFTISDEIVFDFKTDFQDPFHLNTKGATRLSRHLAQYIKTNYDLPDRRNDPTYAEWNEWAVKTRNAYVSAWNKANPAHPISE